MTKAPPGEWVSDFINRFLQQPDASSTEEAATTADNRDKVAELADHDVADTEQETTSDAPTQPSLEPEIFVEARQGRTSAQLADIILCALHSIEGCPKQGFEITVYGSNPWNAMLRITTAVVMKPAAAELWRDRVRVSVQLLREQFDLVEMEDELSKKEGEVATTRLPCWGSHRSH